MYIKDMLNKIKWLKKDINKYRIYYYDRVLKKKLCFDFKDIREISENFVKVKNKDIPLHRIKEIRKEDRLIWER